MNAIGESFADLKNISANKRQPEPIAMYDLDLVFQRREGMQAKPERNAGLWRAIDLNKNWLNDVK
jgi:hypothetical protein